MNKPNIAVCLRDSINGKLKDDNLRGEPRWERQALEALYQSDKFNIATIEHKWDKEKVLFEPNDAFAKDAFLVIQDFNPGIIMKRKWRGVIVNLFSEPWKIYEKQLNELKQQYGKNLIFTYGFPKRHLAMQLLQEQALGKEWLKCLPVPGAPYISDNNNFDKNILLMPYRLLLLYLNYAPSYGSLHPTIQWLGETLEKYNQYQVYFMTGYAQQEASIEEIQNAIFKTAPLLKKHKDRVKILHSISWSEVLDLYKETKLMCHFAATYGGPPIEAGMHGIPFVGRGADNETFGPLALCPNYLTAASPEDSIPYLNRLLNDQEYYTLIGNSYREYVRQTYTYENFANNVFNLIQEIK